MTHYESESDYLAILRDRFPHVQSASLRMLMQSPTFRDMCEEYDTCRKVLRRLSNSPKDIAMRNEYTALSLRIEGELLRYISERGGRIV